MNWYIRTNLWKTKIFWKIFCEKPSPLYLLQSYICIHSSLYCVVSISTNNQSISVVPEPGGGPGGPLTPSPPIFSTSVNPIRNGEGRLSPPITTCPPNVFHLPASINLYATKVSLPLTSSFQTSHTYIRIMWTNT